MASPEVLAGPSGLHSGDSEAPKHAVSTDFQSWVALRALGARTFREYLQQPFIPPKLAVGQSYEQKMAEDQEKVLKATPHLKSILGQKDDGQKEESDGIIALDGNLSQSITRLHQTSQRIPGTELKWEFEEPLGPNRKRCILTIYNKSANPPSLTFATEPLFMRKNEAKIQAAAAAVLGGAINYLLTGNPATALSESQNESQDGSTQPAPEEVSRIEDLVQQFHRTKTPCNWYHLTEPKSKEHGAALHVFFSPSSYCLYVCPPVCDSFMSAKLVCAKEALNANIERFISAAKIKTKGKNAGLGKPFGPLSLETFFESVRHTLPDGMGKKSVNEFNAATWFNDITQSARGCRLNPQFYWFTNDIANCHGCVLRIETPEGYKAYIVPPRFAKRVDAKSAICLQAMSQGLKNYVKTLAQMAERRVTKEMRKFGLSKAIPLIAAEFSKMDQDLQPQYKHKVEYDAYGCSLTVTLSPTESRTYSVEPEYRNKQDSTIALACVALRDGILEYIRFRGGPVPPGWVWYSKEDAEKVLATREMHQTSNQPSGTKRKIDFVDEGTQEAGPSTKKARKAIVLQSNHSSSKRPFSRLKDLSQKESFNADTYKFDSYGPYASSSQTQCSQDDILTPLSGSSSTLLEASSSSLPSSQLSHRLTLDIGSYTGSDEPYSSQDPNLSSPLRPPLKASSSPLRPGTSQHHDFMPPPPAPSMYHSPIDTKTDTKLLNYLSSPEQKPSIDKLEPTVRKRSDSIDDHPKRKKRKSSHCDTESTGMQLTLLYDFCNRNRLPAPKCSFAPSQEGGYDISIQVGSDSYDLSEWKSSLENGQQKLARQVLKNLKGPMTDSSSDG